METNSNLHITLIGCGNWGQYILRDLKSLNCTVTAVCKTLDSRERAKQYGADYIINDIKQIKKVNGFIIATPTNTHLDIIDSILSFDLPIFVEKPLGHDLTKAQDILAKEQDKIFVMDKWRYHPGVEALAEIAKKQLLGPVIGIHTKQFGWGNPHHDVDFLDILLPHAMAIGYEILGNFPDPEQAYTIKRNDIPVALHVLFGKNPWINTIISIHSPVYYREIMLECNNGFAVLKNPDDDYIEIYACDHSQKKSLPLTEKKFFANELPLMRELKSFINYLNKGIPPKSNASLGYEVMVNIAKVRKLLATNKYI